MDPYFSGKARSIGTGVQLLTGASVVEDQWRLTRHLNIPLKYPRNPIITREKPWEGDTVSNPSVLFDEATGRYRMWYRCASRSNYFGAGGPPYHIAYAESEDGINWEKPLMDVCDYPGYDRTNVIYCGTHYQRAQGVQVFKDDKEPDPERRYKMLCLERRPKQGTLQSGVSLVYSPDGYHWRLGDEEHILDYHSDCYNHLVFDPKQGMWFLYCRPIYMHASGRENREIGAGFEGGRHRKRRVAVMTSPDLLNWSYPRTVMYPDEQDTPDYDACRVFVHGNQFIMLYAAMEGDDRASNEVRLATSPDGVHWERFYTREPYIACGESHEWDHGQVHASCRPVHVGEYAYLYYSGTPLPQYEGAGLGSIGLAITKTGRFVEHRAGQEPGYLLTREFVFEGNRLNINTAMRSLPYHEQYIRVEVVRRPTLGSHPVGEGRSDYSQAYDGFSLEDCDPIRVDRTDAPVTWRGNADMSALKGKPVYLRFQLRNMGIYAFEVAKA